MRNITINKEKSISLKKRNENLQRFFAEKQVDGFKPIPDQEMFALIQEFQNGEISALNEIFSQYYRFMVVVANFYSCNSNLEITELLSDAAIGIIYAAERFDNSMNCKFLSYAVRCMQGFILSGLAKKCLVRIPSNIYNNLQKIERRYGSKINGTETDFYHIAREIEISENEIQVLTKYCINFRNILSIEKPLSRKIDPETLEDHWVFPKEILVSEHTTDKKLILESLKKDIHRVLNTLTKRESEVLTLYFALDRERINYLRKRYFTDQIGTSPEIGFTLEEIGLLYDNTRENIRRIKEKAIRRIKNTARSEPLKCYICS